MKNTTIILAIITGATLHGCHKGNSNNTTYINVNAALKAAFNYKVGTYWIYQDSLSGEVDSFFVKSNSDSYSLYYPVGTSNPQRDIEAIGISIIEYNISPTFPSDTQNWYYYYTNYEIDIDYYNDIYENRINYAPFIDYPYEDILNGSGYGAGSSPADTGVIIDTFNEFVVNGQPYSNVIEVNHFLNYTGYTHNDTLFVAPSAGIIKIILHHPLDSLNSYRIWELQRFNLVK